MSCKSKYSMAQSKAPALAEPQLPRLHSEDNHHSTLAPGRGGDCNVPEGTVPGRMPISLPLQGAMAHRGPTSCQETHGH